MKVLIVSDTHRSNANYFKVLELVKPDMVIHCGDIEGSEVAISQAAQCPVYMVSGNNDFFTELPPEVELSIGKYKCLITHGHRYHVSMGPELIMDEARARGFDVVIYGHTHKYSLVEKDGQIWFNPGCCGKRKKDQEVSFAILEIRGKKDFDFRKVVIGNNEETEKLPKDIDKMISKAMKLTDKGKSFEEIAKTCKISEELAESICRMYLTHPGVDVAGILQRIS